MDEKFRQRQRAHQRDPQDIQEALAYIQALEQKLGIQPENKRRMAPDDPSVICLMCEREIESAGGSDTRLWVEIDTRPDGRRESLMMINPWQAISLTTRGNYGSQILDGETLFFYICDGCIIRHSHKMLFRPDTAFFGTPVAQEDKICNARDHFEEWYAALKERRKDLLLDPDSYIQTIKPYFSED